MSFQAKPRSQELLRGIQSVQECHRSCVETFEYVLRAGGQHASAEHVCTLSDCAEVCMTTLTFMLRSSRFYPKLVSVCAEVCEACATLCERMAGDKQIQACAATCRSCAQACRLASSQGG